MSKLAALTVVLMFAPSAVADSKPAKKISKAAPAKQAVQQDDPYADPADKARDALPAAPTDDNYDAWKKRLTAAQRRKVERFCRYDRPADDEPHCGGIGIHRIPSPPGDIFAPGAQAELNAWKKRLNRAQRATYDHLCSQERYAFTQLCGGTPLVVAFDNQRIELTPASAGFATDWPTAATPWLALDRDGDGAITDGRELFGDATVLAEGRTAKGGFEALASLDSNGDGRIDRADPMFASLVLWADRDGDRTSASSELTLASRVIESIELGYRLDPRCDARLNCEREKSVMRYRDATGAVRSGSIVDVYLHHR